MSKLYFLNPHTWGSHWTTCADSPEQALKQMVDSMSKDPYDIEDYNLFKNSTPTNLPDDYTLDELPTDHVIHGEYS